MPEFSYIDLACKKLDVDPDSILAFHEYDDNLAIITGEGKKFVFTFEDLEEFHQSTQKAAEKAEGPATEGSRTAIASPEASKKPTGTTRRALKPKPGNKLPKASKE